MQLADEKQERKKTPNACLFYYCFPTSLSFGELQRDLDAARTSRASQNYAVEFLLKTKKGMGVGGWGLGVKIFR